MTILCDDFNTKCKHVAIVVLNYNGWQDTISCIESLLKLDYSSYEIIVVDNKSTDESLSKIESWANGNIQVKADSIYFTRFIEPNIKKPLKVSFVNNTDSVCAEDGPSSNGITLISSANNRGYAAGNNIGISYILLNSIAEYVWILNNDVVVDPKSLTIMVDYIEKRTSTEKCGILGCKIKYYHNPNLIQCIGGATYNARWGLAHQVGNEEIDKGQYNDKRVHLDFITGASMLVDVAFIKDVGLLEEDYFIYCEETDWYLRGKKNGWNLDYTDKAVIYHKEGATIHGNSGKLPYRSLLSDFYYCRNRILLTKSFFPKTYLPTVYMSVIATILNRIRRRQFNRAKILTISLFNINKHFKTS